MKIHVFHKEINIEDKLINQYESVAGKLSDAYAEHLIITSKPEAFTADRYPKKEMNQDAIIELLYEGIIDEIQAYNLSADAVQWLKTNYPKYYKD